MQRIHSIGALLLVLGTAVTAWADDSTRQQTGRSDSEISGFGFGQFNTGMASRGTSDRYVLFGGRGGQQLGNSARWYIGGGGRGGFALQEGEAGMGYGFVQVGNRGGLGQRDNLGLDAYTGLAFGGYGTADDGGNLLGPIGGTQLYQGTGTGFEFGLYGEVLFNALDPAGSVVTLGLALGGSSGGAMH